MYYSSSPFVRFSFRGGAVSDCTQMEYLCYDDGNWHLNRLSQTESAVFQTLVAVFPKDLFSDYLENTRSVVVSCGGTKTVPRTSL